MGVAISTLTQVIPTANDILPLVQGANTQSTTIRKLWDSIRNDPTLSRNFTGLWVMSGSGVVVHDFKVSGQSVLGSNYYTNTNVLGDLRHSGLRLISSGEGFFIGNLTTSGKLSALANSSTRHDLVGNLYTIGSGVFEDKLQSASLYVIGDSSFGGDTSLGSSSSSIHTVKGPVYFNDSVYLLDELYTESLVRFQSPVEIHDDCYISGNLTGFGDTVLGNSTTDKLTNRGRTYLGDYLWIAKDVFCTGNFNLKGNINITGNLGTLGGFSVFNSNGTIGKLLMPAGNTETSFKLPASQLWSIYDSTSYPIVQIVEGDSYYVTYPLGVYGSNVTFDGDSTNLFDCQYNTRLGESTTANFHRIIGKNLGIQANVTITGSITGTNNLQINGYIVSDNSKYAFISGINYVGNPPKLEGRAIVGASGGGLTGLYHIPNHGLEIGDAFDVNQIPTAQLNGIKVVREVPTSKLVLANMFDGSTSATHPTAAGTTYVRTVAGATTGILGAQRIADGQFLIKFVTAFSNNRYFVTLTPYYYKGGTAFGSAVGVKSTLPTVLEMSGGCLGVATYAAASDSDEVPSFRAGGFFIKCEKFK